MNYELRVCMVWVSQVSSLVVWANASLSQILQAQLCVGPDAAIKKSLLRLICWAYFISSYKSLGPLIDQSQAKCCLQSKYPKLYYSSRNQFVNDSMALYCLLPVVFLFRYFCFWRFSIIMKFSCPKLRFHRDSLGKGDKIYE